MANSEGQVARILYKQISLADIRKILAQSNDSKTGGGARDFRFGSYPKVAPIVMRMFPKQEVVNRRRNGVTALTTIYSGHFYWTDQQNNVHSTISYFEPPTDARPTEGRLASVNEQPCLDPKRMPISLQGYREDNRIFLLLIQLLDDSVWPFYAEERTLRITGMWDPRVSQRMLQCIDAERRSDVLTIGFFDFVNGESYCNGQ